MLASNVSTAEIKKVFATNLRRLRGSRKQSELAHLLDVRQPQIARWESGEMIPEGATIEKIAQALGVDPDELLASRERSFGVSLGGLDELSLRITGKHEFALTLPVRRAQSKEGLGLYEIIAKRPITR